MVSTRLAAGTARAIWVATIPRVAATSGTGLATPAPPRDTAASCSTVVAARRIQWVNTPVLIEAMERQRRGLLPRSMELWLRQLLELPASSPPPDLPGGPDH